MNEAEWLACTDLTPMLEFLRGKASERKLRLTETSSTTVASPASTFAAAGCWTSCWGRSNVMTEKEWLACTDPNRMLTFLRRKTSDRKLRLFACGCCRQIWKDLTLKTVRRAVETAESYADGSVSDHELKQAHTKGVIVCTEMLHRGTVKMMNDPAYSLKMCRMGLAVNVAHDAPFQIGQLDLLGTDDFLKSVSPVLLRCVIGNPFRPLPPKRGKQQWKEKLVAWLAWRDGTIPKLTQAIYQKRAFDRLPVLADALEEAGCTDQDILGHCRRPGEHVRGCWVVDLLIGRN